MTGPLFALVAIVGGGALLWALAAVFGDAAEELYHTETELPEQEQT